MVLRVGGVAVVGAADAVLEFPEWRRIPPEDHAAAAVGGAGPAPWIACHGAVKACRISLRHLPDLADTLLSAVGDDFKPRVAFHRLFQLTEIFDHAQSNAPFSCAFS